MRGGAEPVNVEGATPAWEGLWGEDDRGAFLVGGRCRACRGLALGMREFCPHCHAHGSMQAEPIGRRGRLYTATVVHQAPAGFVTPYRVGYVDVEEGVRVFAHVEAGKQAPRLGDEVELRIAVVKHGADGTLLSGPLYRRTGADR
jgi:uncharacterized OB-fold protein